MLRRKTGKGGGQGITQKLLTKPTCQTLTLCVHFQIIMPLSTFFLQAKVKQSPDLYFPHWYSNCCFWG